MSLFSKSHYHNSQDILFHGIITGRIVQLLPQRALQWLQEARFTWPRKSDLAEKSPPLITLYRQCLRFPPRLKCSVCRQDQLCFTASHTSTIYFWLHEIKCFVCQDLKIRTHEGGCTGCLTELSVWHELCSPAWITLSMGLGTTPASGRGDQAARAGPGDAACGEQTPSPGQESWAGRGGAGVPGKTRHSRAPTWRG